MMLFLHTFHPSPVLASIGPFLVRWYGLFLMLAALAGYVVTLRIAKRDGWSSDAVLSLFVLTLLAGVLGARLYHVLNEPMYYAAHPLEIIKIWHGGLAIHGGLIAGVLVLWGFARRWRLSLLQLTDLAAPGIAIGQAIGRWGNYFNQELFGRPTELPWGIPINPANRPAEQTTAEFFHPTFLYESLWECAVFVLLLYLHRRRQRMGRTDRLHPGIITFAYLGLASIGRMGTELLRIDQTPHLFGIRLPLLVSGALILVAIAGLWYGVRRSSLRVENKPA
ncbi:MAG: prolipoprotein diacylglyceryl transferase [bacterium]